MQEAMILGKPDGVTFYPKSDVVVWSWGDAEVGNTTFPLFWRNKDACVDCSALIRRFVEVSEEIHNPWGIILPVALYLEEMDLTDGDRQRPLENALEFMIRDENIGTIESVNRERSIAAIKRYNLLLRQVPSKYQLTRLSERNPDDQIRRALDLLSLLRVGNE